jgi:hypothetical protein
LVVAFFFVAILIPPRQQNVSGAASWWTGEHHRPITQTRPYDECPGILGLPYQQNGQPADTLPLKDSAKSEEIFPNGIRIIFLRKRRDQE